MKKKYLSLLLRLVVSVGLIAYFVYVLPRQPGGLGGGLNDLLIAFGDAPLYWLIPAGLLHIVGFTLMSLRWKILLKGQSVDASLGQLFMYNVMAAFFNNFLPSTIGGDGVRVMESKKLTGNTTTSVMVVLIERLTGLMALVLIAGAGLVITFFRSPENETQAWLLLGLALAIFATIILLAHPKIAPRLLGFTAKFLPKKLQAFLEKAYSAVEIYYRRPGALLAAQAVSIVFQLNMVFYYYLIARALHQDPDPAAFMVKIPVVIFLLMTAPAVNGLGVRTAGFKGLVGFETVYAMAVETIDLGFRILYGLIGGVVFLFYRRRRQGTEHSD